MGLREDGRADGSDVITKPKFFAFMSFPNFLSYKNYLSGDKHSAQKANGKLLWKDNLQDNRQ